MKRLTHAFPLLLALAAGCQDPSAVPTATRPLFAAAAPSACPTPATVTVSDEAGLRAAIAAATPGTPIGIRGLIGITQDDTIATADVALPRAPPRSRLVALAGSGVPEPLIAAAPQGRSGE